MSVRSLILAMPIAALVGGGVGAWAETASQGLTGPLTLDLSSTFNPTSLEQRVPALKHFGFDAPSTISSAINLVPSATALNTPYAPLAIAGEFSGASVPLANNLQLHVGGGSVGEPAQFQAPALASLTDSSGLQFTQLAGRMATAGVDWNFASWGALGLTATHSSIEDVGTGPDGNAELVLSKAASSSSVGTSVRVGFGGGWVTTVAYSQGIGNLDLKSGSLVEGANTFASSYGLAIAKHGVFDNDNDSIGFAVSRPIQVYSGGVEFQPSDPLIPNNAPIFAKERDLLGGQAQETDLELGYVTSFMNGAFALQANAGYQMNLAGQSGQNSITFISRAKINF